jgi:hypothetical protein
MHSIHKGDPRQVLADDCAACAERSRYVHLAIEALSPAEFTAAWKRAARWQQHGLPGISRAEMPVLFALWETAKQFERRGIPVGTVPGGYATTTPGSQA